MLGQWQEFLDELSDQNLPALVREQELGALNFSEAVGKLKVIRAFLASLSLEDEAELPVSLSQEVSQHVETLRTTIQAMRDFTLAQDQSSTQHQNLGSTIENEREWFAGRVPPFLRAPVVEAAAKLAEITDAHAKSMAAASEVETLLAQIRLGAGEVGANQLASYYENQAKSHADTADRFFRATIAVVVVAAVLVFVGFVLVPIPIVTTDSSDVRWEEFLRNLIVRLVLLGLGSYIITLVARNYRVNKHLQVVNETKRNALNTFVLFSESVPEESRPLITAELVHAVFLPGDSGYLGDTGEKTIVETPGVTALLTRPPS